MNRFCLHSFLLILVLTFISCNDDDSINNDDEFMDPQLKVTSFNIRFNNPDDGINQWDNRKRSVVSFLAIENPDLVGFQEVLAGQLDYMKTRLSQYTSVGVGREDGEDGGEFTPIFFKNDRFNLVDSGTFWLSETPDIPSMGWDAVIKRICTWVILEDRQSGEDIHFYNTHFSHVGPEAREQSAMLIMDSISAKSAGSRVILTGDFNAEPGSAPYNAVISDGLSDSYESDIILGPVGTFNGFNTTGIYDRRIDYIFFEGFNPEYYYCSSLLINNNFLSDHFPVISLLEYRSLK